MFVSIKEFEALKVQVEEQKIMLDQTIKHIIHLEQELKEKEGKKEPTYFG